jgi:hypothetical protein
LVPALAVGLAVLAAFTARSAFSGNPQLIDEVAQLFQAKVFASGRLAAPAPVPSEFFLFQLTTVTRAGWISQFPPGQSLLLAAGMLFRAEWLVNPVLAGLGVLLIYSLARSLYGPRTAGVAAFLWAVCSWVMFMSASYMNHVGAATLALATWALVFHRNQLSWKRGLAAGLMLAAAAATRPLDAVAVGIPIAWWMLQRPRRLYGIPWIALGTLPVFAAWGVMNWRLLGSPLTLGYSAVYGPTLSLGFHADPYGEPFTPLVALGNMAVAIRRLHIYLYEWPIPALLPLVLWALLSRHRHPSDGVTAIGAAAAPVLYFFYWHSGFYLGPRFYYVAVPWLVLATARAWVWAWRRARRMRNPRFAADGALAAAALAVLLWGGLGFLPARFRTYRDSLPTLKLHPERELATRGVGHAVVLVPESWGSRVIADLWALGVSPALVEEAYRHVDLCELDSLRREAHAAGLNSASTTEAVVKLTRATPSPVPRIPGAPDPSLRLRVERALPLQCQTELKRDLDGFTVFGNLAWRNPVLLDHGVIFARDRYAENKDLLARYPGWEVWRFAPPPGAPLALPVLSRWDGAEGR